MQRDVPLAAFLLLLQDRMANGLSSSSRTDSQRYVADEVVHSLGISDSQLDSAIHDGSVEIEQDDRAQP